MPRFTPFRSLLKEQGPLLALILFIILIYVLQTVLVEWNYSRLMLVPGNFINAWESLRSGNISGPTLLEFGPLLSHAFLHGSIGHVFGNMIFLWIFAALTAELLGHRWMFFTFIFTAICGGICHVALNPGEFVPSLGASGAVTGFEGLYLGMAVRWHLPNPHIWPMARPVPPAQLAALGILGLIMDFMGYIGGAMGVAYGAHLGGFIGGMVLGAAVVPMPGVANIR